MFGAGNLFGTNISNLISASKDQSEQDIEQAIDQLREHGREAYNKVLSSGMINEENKNKVIHDFTVEQQYEMSKYSTPIIHLFQYKNKDLVKIHKDAELVRNIIRLFLTYPFLLKLFSVTMRHTAFKEYNELSGAIFINEENKGKKISDFTLEEQTRMSKYADIVSGLNAYIFGKELANEGRTDDSLDNDIVYDTDLFDNIQNMYKTYPFIKQIGEKSPDEMPKSYYASRGGKYSKRRRSKRKRSYKKYSKAKKQRKRRRITRKKRGGNGNANTLLEQAVLKGNNNQIKYAVKNAIKKGATNVNISIPINSSLSIPLIVWAANLQDDIDENDENIALELTNILIGRGADVNSQDTHGDTALMNAVRNKNMYLVRVLINNGADVNKQNILENNALVIANMNYNSNKNDGVWREIGQTLMNNGANTMNIHTSNTITGRQAWRRASVSPVNR